MMGGAFGQISHNMFPMVVTQPTAFVLVGMGGFFAGVAKVPIASLIMVCEMAGSYGLLAPLMLVSVVAFLLSGKFSLYENQVNARIDSPAHRGDFVLDVLENLTVKDALIPDKHVITIPESMSLKEILNLVTNTTQSYFPVINYRGGMTGVISMDDIRRILLDDQMYDLVIAGDMAVTDIIIVKADENLNEVMRKFTIKNLDALPVVSEDDPHRLISMITRREVLSAYNKELQKRKETAS
jgi:CIC family chloride channel protein